MGRVFPPSGWGVVMSGQVLSEAPVGQLKSLAWPGIKKKQMLYASLASSSDYAVAGTPKSS